MPLLNLSAAHNCIVQDAEEGLEGGEGIAEGEPEGWAVTDAEAQAEEKLIKTLDKEPESTPEHGEA
jgi:hypothetical protein